MSTQQAVPNVRNGFISWDDERKAGMRRCRGMWARTKQQCHFQAQPGFDYCQTHLNRGCGKPHTIEPIRLENIEGLAHVAAANALSKCGVSVINENGGWPDLLVKKNNNLFAIEVKKGSDTLKNNQRRVLDALKDVIPCFVLRLGAACGDGEITWAQLLERLNVEPQLPEYFGA